MSKWELETGGTLGEGSEQSPVVYPRPDEEREGQYPKFEHNDNDIDENSETPQDRLVEEVAGMEDNMEGMDESDGGTA